jgi:hypothetical protein
MIDVKVTFLDASNFSLKDFMSIIQAIATTIAILLGGLWSYFLFVKKRQKFPHATISHQIHYKPISNGKALLNVKTVINNSGDVLLSLESGEVRVQQILPLPADIASMIGEGQDPVPENKTEVDWPLIGVRSFTWEKGTCEIEPGENDHFVTDYVVDADIQLVTVYSYFKNTKKYKRDIGWGVTTLYEIGRSQEQNEEKGVIGDEHEKRASS